MGHRRWNDAQSEARQQSFVSVDNTDHSLVALAESSAVIDRPSKCVNHEFFESQQNQSLSRSRSGAPRDIDQGILPSELYCLLEIPVIIVLGPQLETRIPGVCVSVPYAQDFRVVRPSYIYDLQIIIYNVSFTVFITVSNNEKIRSKICFV